MHVKPAAHIQLEIGAMVIVSAVLFFFLMIYLFERERAHACAHTCTNWQGEEMGRESFKQTPS